MGGTVGNERGEAENAAEAVNRQVAGVEEAWQNDVDSGDGEGAGGDKAESAGGEERGEERANGERAEVGEREAERDDVEAEGVGVGRRGLDHVEREEGGVGGSEDREGRVRREREEHPLEI